MAVELEGPGDEGAIVAAGVVVDVVGGVAAPGALAEPPSRPPPPRKMDKHKRYETNHCCKCNGFAAGAARPTAGSTDADSPIWLIWLSV